MEYFPADWPIRNKEMVISGLIRLLELNDLEETTLRQGHYVSCKNEAMDVGFSILLHSDMPIWLSIDGIGISSSVSMLITSGGVAQFEWTKDSKATCTLLTEFNTLLRQFLDSEHPALVLLAELFVKIGFTPSLADAA